MGNNRHDWLCISVLDWNHPTLTSTPLHLMQGLANRGHGVFFVNPPLRWLNDYKLARKDPWLRRKLTEWRKGFVEISPNFYSFTPPPLLPQNRLHSRRLYRAVAQFNQLVFERSLRQALKPHSVHSPLLWITLEPLLGQAVRGKLGEQLAIYHCTDELAGFGTISNFMLELEKEVIRRSHLLIATSEPLREAKQIYNSNAYCIPNAADVAHFKQALQPLPEPEEYSAIPHPRFGFVGNVESRFDAELIYQVAQLKPDWHFVLIGPVQAEYTDLPLFSLPNVHPLGPRPAQQLPAYLRGFDVSLIPYKLNELTVSIYPLKLHEYLAAGKPVLATRLPSLLPFEGTIELISSASEFVAKGEAALLTTHDSAAVAARVAVAEENSWDKRVETVLALIARQLAAKRGVEMPPPSEGSDPLIAFSSQ